MALNFCVCPLGNLDLSVVTTSVWYFWVKSLPSWRWIEQAKKRSLSSRLYKPWLFQLKAVPRLLVWLPPPALLERTALWFHCKLSMAKYPRIKNAQLSVILSQTPFAESVSPGMRSCQPVTEGATEPSILKGVKSTSRRTANTKRFQSLFRNYFNISVSNYLMAYIHTLNTKQTHGKWGHKKYVYLVCEQLNDFLYTVVHRHFSWL